jgi:uncharacterized membrane protein
MKTYEHKKTNRYIFILSLLGVCIAAYVTQSFIRQTGIVCVNSGCELVRNAPQSYLFGFFPVPAVGLIGYTILAMCGFLKTTNLSQPLGDRISSLMLGVSTFGVLFVAWFTYIEIAIIRGICTWCAISAINMCIIWLLLARQYLQKKINTV